LSAAGPTVRSLGGVRRRDGRVEPVDQRRIVRAVLGAVRESGREDTEMAERVADRVLAELGERLGEGGIPGVEQVQDAVVETLVTLGEPEVARRFSAYRRQRAEVREAKRELGVRDELKLSLNAVAILRERYLRRDDQGRVAESTGEMMDRVAAHVAAAEDLHEAGSAERWRPIFAHLLRSLEFLPNSPTLMNAGTPIGLLSGCFVLPIEDSLDSIFATMRRMALIHQAGGGTGFSFSRLRPRGDIVHSTRGVASGPVSFMRVFDAATEVIKQGGRRRGANMAVLAVSHPDIAEFISAKGGGEGLANFNLSVGATDEFMRAVEAGGSQRLVNPRTGELVGEVPAAELFERIATEAWRTGDPGLLFLDQVNAQHALRALGTIEATNPCGEVPLLPYESCNLGSINLARMLSAGAPDWERLAETTRVAVRFLDDVIDANVYPTAEVEEASLATRKLGLGVMGFAEFLALLGVAYDSEEAITLGGTVAATIQEAARAASTELAAERGPFPAWDSSGLGADGSAPRRNGQLTSVAPTGTISIIAGTTAGIEPMFAISYVRNVLGRKLVETNPTFERLARDRGFYSDELIAEIARQGGVRGRREVPEAVRGAFVTALEIEPHWHLRMQAAFQEHVDAAVSKTVNLPSAVSVDDIKEIYRRAWRYGVKGITVYRYGSLPGQVLTFRSRRDEGAGPPLGADAEYAGGCAAHACEF
jgi:ribonucleoside-diphosphate reductase alpha chain